MGHVTHHAVMITCSDEERSKAAYNFALSMQCSVSIPVRSAINTYWSFGIFPDGSKSGWVESTRGDEQRNAMREWLKSQQYIDGSSLFDWCEVSYGSDDGNAVVQYHGWQKPEEKMRCSSPSTTLRGQTRRLSVEMLQELKNEIAQKWMYPYLELVDALHDLDLADKEIALMDTIYDQNQESLREQASELDAAQAIIEQQAGKIAELESGIANELCTNVEFMELKRELRRHEIAKEYCLEIFALKGNSFELNQLVEKIYYALS